MQELLGNPIELLAFMATLAVIFVIITYFASGRIKIKGFTRPRITTSVGMATFLFVGMMLGVFIVMALYMGDIEMIGGDLLFNNIHIMIILVAFVVSFLGALSYLYIYRGGA